MTTAPPPHPLRCQCGTCKTPFAVVRGGVLVIESRHNGEKHTNFLTLEEVRRMLEAVCDRMPV